MLYTYISISCLYPCLYPYYINCGGKEEEKILMVENQRNVKENKEKNSNGGESKKYGGNVEEKN